MGNCSSANVILQPGFLRCFVDPIPVPRIKNQVPTIRENGSLQVHTGYITFSLIKTASAYQ